MPDIQLSPAQIMLGATVGIMRQVQNIKRGWRPGHGAGIENDWQLHIEGALGEMAVAIQLGRFWDGNIGNLDAADVGNVQVRTGAKAHHRLIVHPGDSDEARFYLVTGCNGRYRVHGWIAGKDAKRDEWWQDPGTGRPAYFVPQSALRIDVA